MKLRPGSQFCNHCGKWQPLRIKHPENTIAPSRQSGAELNKEEQKNCSEQERLERVAGPETEGNPKEERQNKRRSKRPGFMIILLLVLSLAVLVFCLVTLLGREDRISRPHSDTISVDTVSEVHEEEQNRIPECVMLDENAYFLERSGSLKTYTDMSVKMQWPENIDDEETDSLQNKLIGILFRNSKEKTLMSAFEQWKNNLGERVDQIPEMKGQKKVGDTLTWKARKELTPQGYINGKFISFTYQSYRLCDQEQRKYDDYPVYAFNYDLENNKELQLSDLLIDEGIKELFGVEKENLDPRRKNANPRTVLFTPTEVVFLKGRNAEEKITIPMKDAIPFLTQKGKAFFN
ncbi:MAG: hypothetical protein J6Y79_00175 [Paludibacteraceae bacterium]|nr:hypothetical protein [Paludibacteraceae bacterium]